MAEQKNIKELDQVIVRFSGDSGDGMQLAGNIFSTISATVGNDICTFPDYPADIRAPQGVLTGVSGFQVHIGADKVLTPGDACDVLVTDGFTGNAVLKTVEGVGKLMMTSLKDIFYANAVTKVSALMIKKQLEDLKKNFDATEHGGAPLLGISRPVIKAHGSSNAKAFKNAIRQAIAYTGSGIIYDIADAAAEFAAAKKAAKEAEAQKKSEK